MSLLDILSKFNKKQLNINVYKKYHNNLTEDLSAFVRENYKINKEPIYIQESGDGYTLNIMCDGVREPVGIIRRVKGQDLIEHIKVYTGNMLEDRVFDINANELEEKYLSTILENIPLPIVE